jgi:pyruvate dehydrogenase E2 component (dihydrolipoamide acetyltransferase)
MPVNVLMPALSPTMEKGNLAKWLKAEGDAIKSGDVIAEIETDKATMEVEAVDEGILAKIVVPAGTADVPVNELIAIIAAEGEDAEAAAAGGATPSPLPAAPPPPSPQGGGMSAQTPAASSPPVGEVAAKAAGGGASSTKLFASPLARRIAKDAGLDLSKIAGSGPHGRIVEKDVKSAMAGGGAKAAPVSTAASTPASAPAKAPETKSAGPSALPTGMSDEVVKKLFTPGSYEEIPHDGMRKTIARRLMESKLTIPHFYLTVDCELDALLKLRTELNAAAPERDGKPAYKLSVNDMVIKALAMSLRAVPDANVTWTENAMLKHQHADVGVAVSIPGGLITPVIKDACHKTLSQISNEMKDLAARAKARKLQPSEYQGGTTAVSNLGMFGIKDFCAVINPPHATILAVGAGEQRAVVKNGAVVPATVMSVTLSTDHRAVDGALGAELLSAFRGYIEKPMGMLV